MLMAVDTSTQMMGLALYDGDRVLGEMVWQTRNHHTVELAPAVGSLLKRCGVASDALSVLGVALGPGSFTSLRIGLALVKGMALGLHLPVVGVPTLDVLAAAQPLVRSPLVCVLQAGRSRMAVGWYTPGAVRWEAQGEAHGATLAELEAELDEQTVTVCGELTAETRQALRRHKQVTLASPAQGLRRPSYLAEQAWNRWQSGQADEVVGLSPIYLHVAGVGLS